MTNPLEFRFDHPDHPHETSLAQSQRFVAAHPDVRYVVLRVDDPAAMGTLLRDLVEWPEHPLLTPCQENRVHAVPVAVASEKPVPVDRVRAFARSLLEPAPYEDPYTNEAVVGVGESLIALLDELA